MIKYTKDDEIINERLDNFIVRNANINKTKIKKMIEDNLILINGKYAKKQGVFLRKNDNVQILKDIEMDKNECSEGNKILPWQKKIEIFYENNFILIAKKPNGILTHPTSFKESDTFVGMIKNYWNETNNNNFDEYDIKQGLCHRLDKYTEGLLIVAKNNDSKKKIEEMIQKNLIKREYIAILNGKLKADEVTVNAPISRSKKNNLKMEVSKKHYALDAITHFSIIQEFKTKTLVKCVLETGRTHQIRVHAKYINASVLNDHLYGSNSKFDNYQQYLVANKISFIDPFTRNEINIEYPLPIEFINKLNHIKNEN
ncbi:MAG: RluA family pseudouridine synthase [Mycoplasmoidaceae bacterium]